MACNVYILLVGYNGHDPIKKFVASKIREVEQLGDANHAAIAIEYGNDCLVFHSVFPRPTSITMQEFLKQNKPVLVWRREVKNERLMFQMLMWLSIKGSHAYYGLTENILIWLKRTFAQLKEYVNVWKVNHDEGLNCSEYAIKFLNWAWPDEFTIERDEDSLGLKEVADACNRSMLLLNQDQVNALSKSYLT